VLGAQVREGFSMRGVSLAFHICIMYRININTKYMIRNTGEIQMAREGITFEQVAAAADALVGEGVQPTIRAVRERLGTGSPNTIHRHLVAWREARPAATAAAPELPAPLAAALANEIERAAAAGAGRGRSRVSCKLSRKLPICRRPAKRSRPSVMNWSSRLSR
jgi:hypothetical protein